VAIGAFFGLMVLQAVVAEIWSALRTRAAA
jgi:hypothetical protein